MKITYYKHNKLNITKTAQAYTMYYVKQYASKALKWYISMYETRPTH